MTEQRQSYIVRGQDVTRVRTSVELETGQSQALQAIALELGYVQTRGVGAGTVGSVSQLVQAIARGDVIVKPKA